VVIQVHHLAAPYTKVEESFNIQAIHDILINGIPLRDAGPFFTANYDHLTFPGSVPRTFVGAVTLAGLISPLRLVFGDDVFERTFYQLLGLYSAQSLLSFWFLINMLSSWSLGSNQYRCSNLLQTSS